MPSDFERTGFEIPQPLNKEQWYELVNKGVAEAKVEGSPVFVMVIDINNLKDVNDDLGHDWGDAAIEEASNAIGASIRIHNNPEQPRERPDLVWFGNHGEDADSSHVFCRWGGDEFMIFGFGDTLATSSIEKRVRDNFGSRSNIKDLKEQLEELNVNVGLAIGSAVLEEDMSAIELIAAADVKMYEDKLKQAPTIDDDQGNTVAYVYETLVKANINPRLVIKHFRQLGLLGKQVILDDQQPS